MTAYLTERLPIRTQILKDAHEIGQIVAREIAAEIKRINDQGRTCVLGLATGSSPLSTYEALIQLHRKGQVSFQNVVVFMLDEYRGLGRDCEQSFYSFINRTLLAHIDLPEENFHIPDGTVSDQDLELHTLRYEAAIQRAGGIDLQLLGIGRTGHLGFNEPGRSRDSRTASVELHDLSRRDAAADFFGLENVPRNGITMGLGTIFAARRLIVIATNEGKAGPVKEMLEGPISENFPASLLQDYAKKTQVFLDEPAAAALTIVHTPWVVDQTFDWSTLSQERRAGAVFWLCQRTGHSLRQLTTKDFDDNGMSGLLKDKSLNDFLLGILVDYSARGSINPPRSSGVDLILSPHPDDIEIQMGGTVQRLIQQGRTVYAAAMVSGNIAVWDSFAQQILDRVDCVAEIFGESEESARERRNRLIATLKSKPAGNTDCEEILAVKAAVRRSEMRHGLELLGVPLNSITFLDLPFYETGGIKKKPVAEEDYRILMNYLESLQPDRIYAAGDLSDPHGTHRVCLDCLLECLRRLRAQGKLLKTELLLYRGAWAEWALEDMDEIVPLSAPQFERKLRAVRAHRSQVPRALFPGTDDRPFDKRAEERNRATALLLKTVGIGDFPAAEGFRRCRELDIV